MCTMCTLHFCTYYSVTEVKETRRSIFFCYNNPFYYVCIERQQQKLLQQHRQHNSSIRVTYAHICNAIVWRSTHSLWIPSKLRQFVAMWVCSIYTKRFKQNVHFMLSETNQLFSYQWIIHFKLAIWESAEDLNIIFPFVFKFQSLIGSCRINWLNLFSDQLLSTRSHINLKIANRKLNWIAVKRRWTWKRHRSQVIARKLLQFCYSVDTSDSIYL